MTTEHATRTEIAAAVRATPLCAAVLPSVAGPLAVVVDGGVVVASGFGSLDDAISRLPADVAQRPVEVVDDLGEVSAAVAAWSSGEVDALDRVAVRQPGSTLLQSMWAALRQVPAGETVSYAGLAARAGSPRAVRLAGSACSRNRVAPFVPCHRVVRSDGSLGGYYYGLDVKRVLLEHESASEVDRASRRTTT